MEGKVYKMGVRPTVTYDLKMVVFIRRQEAGLVAEFKMLRFSLGATRIDIVSSR